MASSPLLDIEDAGLDSPLAFARDIVDIAATSSRSHPHAVALARAPVGALHADAIHLLALLHGPRPSAASVAASTDPLPWLRGYAERFAEERAWLMQAVARTGAPRRLRETSRHEMQVRHQREAMLMLMRSDRAGCALGAAAALAADWPHIRAALSDQHGPGDPDYGLIEAIAAAAVTQGARRAIGFGMAQMVAVHRKLWDLLEARQAASLP